MIICRDGCVQAVSLSKSGLSLSQTSRSTRHRDTTSSSSQV